MTYSDFIKETKFLKDKIILPDNIRVNKSKWITSTGFDFNAFNSYLMKIYKERYEKLS